MSKEEVWKIWLEISKLRKTIISTPEDQLGISTMQELVPIQELEAIFRNHGLIVGQPSRSKRI